VTRVVRRLERYYVAEKLGDDDWVMLQMFNEA
jgi:hypothetical protein